MYLTWCFDEWPNTDVWLNVLMTEWVLYLMSWRLNAYLIRCLDDWMNTVDWLTDNVEDKYLTDNIPKAKSSQRESGSLIGEMENQENFHSKATNGGNPCFRVKFWVGHPHVCDSLGMTDEVLLTLWLRKSCHQRTWPSPTPYGPIVSQILSAITWISKIRRKWMLRIW